jgi:hypothetical protein
MKIEITRHAVDQYLERFSPRCTLKEGNKALSLITRQGKVVESQAARYRFSAGGDCNLILRKADNDNDSYVCVTVIPSSWPLHKPRVSKPIGTSLAGLLARVKLAG